MLVPNTGVCLAITKKSKDNAKKADELGEKNIKVVAQNLKETNGKARHMCTRSRFPQKRAKHDTNSGPASKEARDLSLASKALVGWTGFEPATP